MKHYLILLAFTCLLPSCKTTSDGSAITNSSLSQDPFVTCKSKAQLAKKGEFDELTLTRDTLNQAGKSWSFILTGRSPVNNAQPPRVGTFTGDFKVSEIRVSTEDYDLPSQTILIGSGKILLQGQTIIPIRSISVSQGDAAAVVRFENSDTIAKAPNDEWLASPCKFNAKQYQELQSDVTVKH